MFGIVVGVPLLIWSAYSLATLPHPALGAVAAFYRGVAPVTQGQMYWAMFFLGGIFVGLAFALRSDQ
jgi:hypothetical protein